MSACLVTGIQTRGDITIVESSSTGPAVFSDLLCRLLRVDHDLSRELSDVYYSIFSVPHGKCPSQNVLHRVLNQYLNYPSSIESRRDTVVMRL